MHKALQKKTRRAAARWAAARRGAAAVWIYRFFVRFFQKLQIQPLFADKPGMQRMNLKRGNRARSRCFSIFAGLAASLAFAACDYLIPSRQPASSSTRAVQRPVGSVNSSSGSGATNASGNEWGWVSCANESEYQEFNRQVRQFLSTSFDTNALPPIGCVQKHAGGRVLFKGSVVFEGGAVLNASNPSSSSLDISSQSWIEIHVDTADRSKRTQSRLQVQPVKLSASGGNVDGRAAVLNFQDDKGEIRLEGNIEGEKFKGRFIYKNYTTWKGDNTGYEGNMGIFSIRTCRFFQCS